MKVFSLVRMVFQGVLGHRFPEDPPSDPGDGLPRQDLPPGLEANQFPRDRASSIRSPLLKDVLS